MTPSFADTVIVSSKDTLATYGDIGRVTELDNQSRSVKVTFRHGYSLWFFPADLFVVPN